MCFSENVNSSGKNLSLVDLFSLYLSEGMPCLHSDALEFMESDSATTGASPAAGTEKSYLRESVTELPVVRDMGWFFSPLWSPRSKTRSRFGGGGKGQVEAWLDDHSDFTRAYFLRRASTVSAPRGESPMPMFPRSSSDHSDLLRKAHHRRTSSPLTSSHLNISSLMDSLKPLASNLRAPEWMDSSSPDILGSYSPCSPCSPRSSRCSFYSNRPLSPVCPCSSNCPHTLCPTITNTAACGKGECCPWMLELMKGGLSWMGSVAELCQGAVLHAGELLAADCCSLSLVKKDCCGRNTLEEVIAPTALGCLSEGNLCSHAHLELLKRIMGCVLATGSPVNLRDASEDPRFHLDDNQSKIRTVLSVPIKAHRGEVVGVMIMINKRDGCDGSVSVFTKMDEKVLSNHMDVLGMVLDNVQLYESSRQEAKRSQALIEMAQVLSMEHCSFEILLSKMAATIMPFTRAQYCTIFIPSQQSSVVEDQVYFSRVIHLECEELGSTCQVYRRQRDISDIDQSSALQTLVAMKTLNMSKSSEGSMKTVCQLMNKKSRDSDEMEAFNRYDERLLEDLSVYCGLALQYAQAVQITEERRASIEVTQEVLAYHITAAESEVQALQEATIPSVESLNILDFHFSDFGLPEDLTTQATIRMFLDLNLVQDFNIDYKSLCQWVLTVRRGYRNSVPYHNWNHALSTAQSMFAMLMATDKLQPLAQLYGHSSLENHHYNLCLFILNNTVKNRVLFSRQEKQSELEESMLMTASDLSAITKPWPEQKRIAKLVTMEFFAQGDKEKEEFKIKPIDIMNRENSTRLPYMQVEYIDDICYPLYEAVSRLFNTCSPLLKGCKKNRENWMQLTEKADEEDCENSSCAALETHNNNEEKTQTEE
ncbi:hypothetical protein FQN60_012008 [Etheostoma spectabile]|uniref:PDEase domain-containing protein n=1 Tax=Etheostoma spectabile TaxID=54343 RepID=A0A5J5DNV6_9PERO|nr:hypothetical protein FQN60_012008 [Etheostoma spectabile]